MARPKKDGVYINYYIERSIKERLDEYCDEVGQTNTMAIERILKKFLDEHDKKKTKYTIDNRGCMVVQSLLFIF